MTNVKETLKTLLYILLVSLVLYGIYLGFTSRPLKEPLKPITSIKIPSTSTLKLTPKTSKADNDLEITQSYKAKINGSTVEIPLKTLDTSTHGTKATFEQTLDLTDVVNQLSEQKRKEDKRNWELGAGLGVHQGDWYVPVSLQRNFNKNRAIEAEVHLNPKEPTKVNGGEIKYKIKF